MPDQPTCNTCRFWVRRPESPVDDGDCHRYPPNFEHPGNQWPRTQGLTGWCGEHKPVQGDDQ